MSDDLWARVVAAFPDPSERCQVHDLIRREIDEMSTLVAYTDERGEWHDVEPNWSIPETWADAPENGDPNR